VHMQYQNERETVLETSRKLVEKGLVIGKSGNVSMRLRRVGNSNLMAITPTSRYYDGLMPADIPVVDFEGKAVDGGLAPSSEILLHTAIYRTRADVNAVIHTHSTCASAVSVARIDIPPILEEEVASVGGEIKVARYAKAGTRELARNAVKALGDRNAVILANHGAVGVGRTMREALTVCELVEKAATIYLITLAVGKVNPLTAEGLASAKALFARLQSTEDV